MNPNEPKWTEIDRNGHQNVPEMLKSSMFKWLIVKIKSNHLKGRDHLGQFWQLEKPKISIPKGVGFDSRIHERYF